VLPAATDFLANLSPRNIIAAFGVLIYAGIRIAISTTDPFGRLLAAGVTSWIGLQALINLGAVTGLLPITGVPLPLASVLNRRSLIFLDNLVDAISRCVEHPEARGPLLFNDAESVSTPELAARMARALDRPARLFHVPPALLRMAGTVSRRRGEVRSLTRSLVIDPSRASRLLEWRPRRTLDEGLTETANWFRTLSD